MGFFSKITDALGLTSKKTDKLIAGQKAFDTQVTNRSLAASAPYIDVGQNALADLATFYGQEGPRGRYDPYAPIDAKGNGVTMNGATGGAGSGSLASRTASFMERFKKSPLYSQVYKSFLDEGTKAYERNATANGRLNSGSTVTGIGEVAARAGASTLGDYVGGIERLANAGRDQTGVQLGTLTQGQGWRSNTTDAKIQSTLAKQGALGGYLKGGFKLAANVATGGTSSAFG